MILLVLLLPRIFAITNYRYEYKFIQVLYNFRDFFLFMFYFLDKGNCAHFIAACIISKRFSDDTKEFVTVKARGRPKLTKGALKK